MGGAGDSSFSVAWLTVFAPGLLPGLNSLQRRNPALSYTISQPTGPLFDLEAPFDQESFVRVALRMPPSRAAGDEHGVFPPNFLSMEIDIYPLRIRAAVQAPQPCSGSFCKEREERVDHVLKLASRLLDPAAPRRPAPVSARGLQPA